MRDPALEIAMLGDQLTAEVTLPTLPFDGDTYAAEQPGHAADLTCAELLADSLGAEISGFTVEEFRKVVALPEPTTRRKSAPRDLDLYAMTKRAEAAIERAPSHKRTVQRMVDTMRGKLRKFESGDTCDYDLLYIHLADSIEKFVQTTVILG